MATAGCPFDEKNNFFPDMKYPRGFAFIIMVY